MINRRGKGGERQKGDVQRGKGPASLKEENEKKGLAEEKTKPDDESNKMQVDSSSSKEG